MRPLLKRVGVALAGALLASSTVAAPAFGEPAALSGTLTAADTGSPLAGCVQVWDGYGGWVTSTCTDDSGVWSVDGLEAGASYKIEASTWDSTHVGEWAQDATSYETATTFTAPATVDIGLPLGAVIAGTLTMSDGDPVPSDVGVNLWSSRGEQVGYASVTDGQWQTVMPAGDYRVEFSSPAVHQWAVGKSSLEEADPVTGVAGQTSRVDDVLPGIDETHFEGTLTDAGTGEPIDGCVSAYAAATRDWRGSACTGEDGSGQAGHWTMSNLTAGTEFKFEFSSWDGVHASEWGQDTASFERAPTFVGPATIDVALERAATISGTLRDAEGQPVDAATIVVHSLDDDFSQAYAWPTEDHTWSASVRPGSYVVEFQATGVQQWALGSPDREGATVYAAKGGESIVVDDQLPALGRVNGTVTDASTGQPVAGACVDVVPSPVNVESPSSVGRACTDDAGHYSVEVSGTGTFTAEISDEQGRYAGEYAGNTLDPSEAQSFEMTEHGVVTLDADLAPGATITGVALDAKLATPVEGVCPQAWVGTSGAPVRWSVSDCTGADGRWTLRGLPAGSFAVQISGDRTSKYLPTWAFRSTSQRDADLVTVKSGETRSIRSVKLLIGGSISGVVRDPFGKPVANAYVDADGRFPGRAGPGEGVHVAHTDAAGRYTINGLPAGDYRPIVYADDYDSFAPEWSGDAVTLGSATPLTVKSDKTTTFDATVAPASRIVGDVVRPDGSPATAFLEGDVFNAEGAVVGFAVWNGSSLSTTALPAGDVTFFLRIGDDTGQTFWFDRTTRSTEATVVHLTAGEQQKVTFHLPEVTPAFAG